MNSALSTGGGNSAGATAIWLAAFLGLYGVGQLRDDLVEVADDSEIAELEDRGVRVLLIATMFSEDCMPTLCWIAPEIPVAM